MNAVVKHEEHEQVVQPWAMTAEAQMLNMVERLIRDPNIPLDRVKEAIALKREMDAMTAEKAFDEAISDAKAEIPPIIKNRVVDFESKRSDSRTNYRFEDLAQIAKTVDPILAKHGLSYRHETAQQGQSLTITCVLAHRLGHKTRTSFTANVDTSGNKNAIQGIMSTTTSLQRYTLKAALGLAVSNDDDGNAHRPPEEDDPLITTEQAARIRQALEFKGRSEERFLKHIQLERIEDIRACKFEAALKIIENAPAQSNG